MAQATITARIDSADKISFLNFCSDVGLSASSAISLFIKTVLRKNAIPFSIDRVEDPFYSEANMRMLESRYEDAKKGLRMVEHDIIEV